jgi:hypothetical protein
MTPPRYTRSKNRQRLQFVVLEDRIVPSQPPVAADDFSDTDGNNPVTVHILANDHAIPPAQLSPSTVSIVSPPSHGQVSVDPATGDATYTSIGFFMGTDVFRYTVKDTLGQTSNRARVTVIVNRPTANDDFADTDGNNPVTINVLANDTDPDGNNQLNPASVTVVSPPAHGTFSVNPSTGAITYTAIGSFTGTDTLQYTVTDFPGAVSAPGTVTIVVNRPVANDDSVSTVAGTPIAINVLSNDTDPDGNDHLDPSTVTVKSGPSHGITSVNHTTGQVTYTPNANFRGTDTFQYTVTDFPGAESNPATVRVRVTYPTAVQVFAIGDASGPPLVKIYNIDGTLKTTITAYDSGFQGGVRVAVGDVNGDGVPDIVTAAGPGGTPLVKVFSGTNFSLLNSFLAYNSTFSGGVNVAVADVNGDGFADIITGAGASGGPHVKAFSGNGLGLLQNFFAYNSTFTGGVNVAAGDVNGDGIPDIITGAGPGGGPHVRAFNAANAAVLREFLAYSPLFLGGVYVAAGDTNGDGYADIITGAGDGGGPHVKVISGFDGSTLHSFFAYTSSFRSGVRVGAVDFNHDGVSDLLVGPALTAIQPTKVLDGPTLAELDTLDPGFIGGVFVGGLG